tara:strand:- start:53 stop:565 length:513 start_codon:yes stop_codon:yes gene_type:complete
MSYFSNFSTILYDPAGDGSGKLCTDILSRVRVRANMKKEIVLMDKYDIQENETPEILADRHHGSPHYHWVILLLNGVADVHHDWPKSTRQLQKYITGKYTEEQLSSPHHYTIYQTSGDTTKTIECLSTQSGAVPVTNYEYEVALNDAKRSIDLLRNDYLGLFVDEFQSLV